ncbi:hypothetical protein FP828_03525 [bacterium]|nr:hypothetical protein [bacterium]
MFKSEAADFQWAAYIYGASANIEKLINQELQELSLEHPAEVKTEKKTVVKEQSSADIIKDEFPKKKAKPKEEKISEKPSMEVSSEPEPPAAISAAPAIEQFERQGTSAVKSPAATAAPAVSELLETFDKPSLQKKAEPVVPVLETFEKPDEAPAAAAPVIEKFEQFTPDQSAEKPLSGPLIETFAGSATPAAQKEEAPVVPEKEPEIEKPEARPIRKDATPIDVLYLCPERSKDKADLVKENIAKIVAEKNINFEFKSAGVVVYAPGAAKAGVMEEIAKYKFSFILVVAPDAMGEELLREIKKKGFVPKVITEDNIDKKFRYLNLITDIVLSPRR